MDTDGAAFPSELADRLKAPERPDYRRYRDRNRVERMFGKLKQRRRIATRYDKTVLSSESCLNLAGARLWLKTFVNADYALRHASRVEIMADADGL